jgi:hypothetical protein
MRTSRDISCTDPTADAKTTSPAKNNTSRRLSSAGSIRLLITGPALPFAAFPSASRRVNYPTRLSASIMALVVRWNQRSFRALAGAECRHRPPHRPGPSPSKAGPGRPWIACTSLELQAETR